MPGPAPSGPFMSTPFKLRPYQKAAVAAVNARYRSGDRRLLLYLPTGAGKTVIATFIIDALRRGAGLGRCLFVAHRREILDQTARTIARHLPGLSVQVEQGERSASDGADVIVASVQSLIRRKERYPARSFDLIICDECHHALSPSWSEVISYFWSQAEGKTLLLGMTATPRRSCKAISGSIGWSCRRVIFRPPRSLGSWTRPVTARSL
jgi:ATP-dependent helicase IRC3